MLAFDNRPHASQSTGWTAIEDDETRSAQSQCNEGIEPFEPDYRNVAAHVSRKENTGSAAPPPRNPQYATVKQGNQRTSRGDKGKQGIGNGDGGDSDSDHDSNRKPWKDDYEAVDVLRNLSGRDRKIEHEVPIIPRDLYPAGWRPGLKARFAGRDKASKKKTDLTDSFDKSTHLQEAWNDLGTHGSTEHDVK
ncbi:hypothetical protein FDECE_3389 [Fusarium decemcellulare]|nr:hypothetical protein FDECE_3389 [Fusarium decemcellulare]